MRSVSEDCHLQFMQLLKILITQLYARLSNSSVHLYKLTQSDQIIQFFRNFVTHFLLIAVYLNVLTIYIWVNIYEIFLWVVIILFIQKVSSIL